MNAILSLVVLIRKLHKKKYFSNKNFTGKSANLCDVDNVDWVPSLNMPCDQEVQDAAGLDSMRDFQGAYVSMEESDFQGFGSQINENVQEGNFNVLNENNGSTNLLDDDRNTVYLDQEFLVDDDAIGDQEVPDVAGQSMDLLDDETNTVYLDEEFLVDDEDISGLSDTFDEFYAIDDVENDFYGYENDTLTDQYIESEEVDLKTEYLEIELLETKTENIEFEQKFKAEEKHEPRLSSAYVTKVRLILFVCLKFKIFCF